MKWLAVLYDDHCGICSRLKVWLEKQTTFVPLRPVALHSPNLALQFPGIEAFHPEEKLVVIADDGSVWRGDSAWLMLLWTLESGRELSFKMASPALRPFAQRAVTAVSMNRLKLSRWFGLRAENLSAVVDCREGNCRLPMRKAFPDKKSPPPLPMMKSEKGSS